ncbi:MAG TPA: hypothetical protein VGL20_02895 [Candidatus Dormibacteraeota bacterium]
MRLRSSKLALAVVAFTATGTMAVTTTTAFASSHHGGSTKTTVKGNGNCTVVNSSHVTCNVSKHNGHGGNGGNWHGGHGGRNDPGLGHGLEDVVAGVGDILGGLLGGL